MRELIRKILKEDLEYSHVTDASPESDEYEMSEGWEGIPKKEELSPQVEEFLFEYWSKNGTELTPCRYIGINCLEHEEEIDKLKIKFYGGIDKAFELALKEIKFFQPMKIVDGGYDFNFIPISTKDRDVVGSNQYGTHGVITKGHVYLSDLDVTHDFAVIFGSDDGIVDPDFKDEVSWEIRGAINEKFQDIFDKYGLLHNYVSYKFSPIV